MKKLLITVNGKRYEVDVEVIEDDEVIQSQPVFQPPARSVTSLMTPQAAPAPAPTRAQRAAAGAPRASTGSGGKTLTSPINGTLLDIAVNVGDEVQENQTVFVVEAMKMKTNIASPQAGRIKAINVRVKDVIEQGQVLLSYE
jgi:glutaconyl-CoA/methylmalonyl-CoA decarboxylase subunit gamma